MNRLKREVRKRYRPCIPTGYREILAGVKRLIGEVQPEHVGKSLFYVAALDEQVRLPHEKPSVGLILCRSAKRVQVRLALTRAAEKVGVATYQTALPDEELIRQRLEQLPPYLEKQ